LKADPDCGIAYWGIALSLLNNPHAPPPVGNLPLGLAAIEKGKAIGAKTQRERDFINALAAFYTDFDKVDHRTRVLAYLKAMEGVDWLKHGVGAGCKGQQRRPRPAACDGLPRLCLSADGAGCESTGGH